MNLPRRPIILALLALCAPLPALAVTGDNAPSGPASLSVSTTLGSCGVTDSRMVCQLNVSFEAIEGATSYTASVTRADGSVVDYGAIPAGGASLPVPYVGAGTYSVTVTAFGTPEEPGEPKEKIATGVSDAGAESGDEGKVETDAEATAEAEGAQNEGGDAGGAAESAPAEAVAVEGAEEACVEPAPPAPPVPPEPPSPPADADPNNPDEDADGVPDAQEAAEYEQLMAEREAAISAAEAAEASTPTGC